MAGNVLHKLLPYAPPHVKHVVTTTLVAPVEDDSSLAKNPIAHLHRQAVKISQGKRLGPIILFAPT